MEMIKNGLLPEALMLGIPRVDAQHDDIFCRIENLKFHCVETNALSQPLVKELLCVLREHFDTEAQIADSAGVDFVDHDLIHRHTLASLDRWIDRVLNEERDIFSFLRFLEVWFERHIREEDLPFAHLLTTKAIHDAEH